MVKVKFTAQTQDDAIPQTDGQILFDLIEGQESISLDINGQRKKVASLSGNGSADIDLSEYVKKEDLPDVSDFVKKDELPDGTTDLTDYLKKSEFEQYQTDVEEMKQKVESLLEENITPTLGIDELVLTGIEWRVF